MAKKKAAVKKAAPNKQTNKPGVRGNTKRAGRAVHEDLMEGVSPGARRGRK